MKQKNIFFENKINASFFGKSSDFSCILLFMYLRNSFFHLF
jgi:hypothetical protein